MAIKNIDDNVRTRCIGKLRLGIIKPGSNFPMDVDYFVTKDAPEVEAVYGKEPKEIEVFFAAPTIDQAVPYFYKWWSGGAKDKDGNLIGGKIQCSGDGVTADHHMKRDPVTRVVPKRQCLGEQCPDWNSANGNPQCRPQMTIKVWIPRVSLLGYYEIDTKSIMNINNILGVLKPLAERARQMSGVEDLRGIPFSMSRVPVKIDTYDAKGKQIKTTHWPISIRPLEPTLFAAQYGKELEHRARSYTLAAVADTAGAITSDVVEPQGQIEHVPEASKGPAAGIEAVAEDQELAPMFVELTTLLKKTNNAKLRLLTARKFEGTPNPKESLKQYLQEQIITLKPRQEVSSPATTPQAGPTPNADGLI